MKDIYNYNLSLLNALHSWFWYNGLLDQVDDEWVDFEKDDTDLSFIIAVSEDEYELLKSDLKHILDNQEEYDNVWDAMMDCIEAQNVFAQTLV